MQRWCCAVQRRSTGPETEALLPLCKLFSEDTMKKYTIRWIIGLISIALLGLLCVQLYWVDNAIAMKKELFRQSVNGAMTAVVSRLEKREVASAVAQAVYAMPEAEEEEPEEPPVAEPPSVAPEQPVIPTSSGSPEPMVHSAPVPRQQQRTSAVAVAEPARQRVSARSNGHTLYHYTPRTNPRTRTPQTITIFPDNSTHEQLNRTREQINRARENAVQAGTALRFVNLDSIRKTMRVIMDSAGHRQTFFIDAPQLSRSIQVSSRQSSIAAVQGRSSGGTLPVQIRSSDGTSVGMVQMNISSGVSHPDISWNFAIDDIEEQARQIELHTQHLREAFEYTFDDMEMENFEEFFPPQPEMWVQVHSDTFQRYRQMQSGGQPRGRATAVAMATGSATPAGSAPRTTARTAVQQQPVQQQPAQQRPVQQQPARQQRQQPAPQQQQTRPMLDRLVSIKDMASCVVMELATGSQPIEQRVSAHIIDSLLKVELAQRGITLPFQYAVLSGNNEFALTRPAVYTNELQQSTFRTALYPNDIIAEPHYLSIHFPRQDEFVYESMWGVLATSLTFILLILCCFSFTVVTLFRQKKLSDMKTDFINNMTHEFKTPIATISLASEALRDPAVRGSDNRVMRFINAIYEENKRLGTQVERVLQAAVIDRGDVQLNLAPVDVHEVLEQALHTVALQVESRGGTIECRFGAENNVIEADRVHLANVIINLLDNANKYSPEQPFIRLTTRNEHNGIVISVEDNGIGMSREAQKKIFEKFYRVSTGNLHDVKGFGLGLSYVKAMVDAHGGSIGVRSELRHGSHFDLYFPYAAQEAVVS